MKSPVLGAAIIAVLALTALAMVPSPQQQDGTAMEVLPVLKVYKNGQLVYEKTGDLPTYWLSYIWLASISPKAATDGSAVIYNVVKLDGNSYSLDPDSSTSGYWSQGVRPHTMWVLAGTSSTNNSYLLSQMQLVGAGEAKLVEFSTAGNEVIFKVAGAITFDANYTVREVGLSSDIAALGVTYDPLSSPGNHVLLFRDLLPQPISVGNGDTLEVQYEIHITYPTG